MNLSKRVTAEFIGTFWLVLGELWYRGARGGISAMGVGFVGVALAFGLTLLTMAYAIGHISGCYINSRTHGRATFSRA